MNDELVFAFATDEQYIAPTYLAIFSLLRQRVCKKEYRIYILVPLGIEKEKISYLLNLQECFRNVTIEMLYIDSRVDDCHMSAQRRLQHISNTTYYRFFLPELLKNYDKCIYLDVDIVVLEDLNSLWEINIDDYLIAGVRNKDKSECSDSEYMRRCSQLEIDSLDEYVNAGVLLMNLKRMRDERISEKLFEKATSKTFDYNDQDILNSVCYGNIRLLPYRYNVLVSYLKDMELASDMLDCNYEKEIEKPIIIHYATAQKPWLSKYYMKADIWNENAMSVSKEIYSRLIQPFIIEQHKRLPLVEKIKAPLKQFKFYRRLTTRFGRV